MPQQKVGRKEIIRPPSNEDNWIIHKIMATIALYANKISQMPELIKDVKQTVTDYKSELSALKTKTLMINKSVCNLDDVISSIQVSTQTQEQKIASLDVFNQNSEQFISDAARIDRNVAGIVKQRKDDFYNQYNYLKQECEKSGWGKFCDELASVGEWCKENWKAIGKILLTVVIIVALGIATALTGGILGVILGGAFWGASSGALIGGVMGGITSAMNGGSFLDGFADGALSGAVTGAITGAAFAGIGVLGSALGKTLQCGTKLANLIKVTSKVTKVISLGMSGFDLLAMSAGFIWGNDNPLTAFNAKLHSSALYNGFQVGVSALAIFTGTADAAAACFIAGTMILTATGLVAIENIKVGDKVISTNTDTFETAEKTVVETYIREVPKLVHLTINSELISTTVDHPFYVKNRGFINAVELRIGNELIDSDGKILFVEDIRVELAENPVTVYNFQVEDFHTYHVGNLAILVHNADYSGDHIKVDSPDPAADKLAERIDGESRVRFSNDATGREFDAISDSYVAQSKPADFQLGSSFRNQAKATFEAASQNGKQPYFHFEGPPDPNVLNKIAEYASRYGIEPIIDITPLF